MRPPLTLVSHALCPYVQRAAIVLAEKGVPFERRDIDLADKPGWFLALSPLGKTPLLQVGDEALFESAVICEYLDETEVPRLHPADPLQRARHRAWVEFGSALLNAIGTFYNAADDAALAAAAKDIHRRFAQVDAAFGPVFRYLDVFDAIGDFGFIAGLPRVARWRAALAQRPSVRGAVAAGYAARLLAFLRARNAALSRRIAA